MTCFWQGRFPEERTHLEEALKIYDPERDREAKFRFGLDTGVCATIYLAQANWLLGDIGRARDLIEDGERGCGRIRARHDADQRLLFQGAIRHITRRYRSCPARRGDCRRTQPRARALALRGIGNNLLSWARARLGGRETGVTELRAAVAAFKRPRKQIVRAVLRRPAR